MSEKKPAKKTAAKKSAPKKAAKKAAAPTKKAAVKRPKLIDDDLTIEINDADFEVPLSDRPRKRKPKVEQPTVLEAITSEPIAPEAPAEETVEQPKNNRILTVFALLFIAAMVLIGVNNKESNEPVNMNAVPKSSAGMGKPFTFGDTTGKAPILSIWEDFQCPYCKGFEMEAAGYVYTAIMNKTAQVEFYTLSFLGPESVRAAQAAACADDQDKFFDYHLALYAAQPQEQTGGFTNEQLIDLGTKVKGIDAAKFGACVNSGKYQKWVQSIAQTGVDLGVNRTPTLWINKQPLSGDIKNVGDFARAIGLTDEMIKGTTQK